MRLLTTAIIAALPSLSLAQEECVKLENNEERLACYDIAFGAKSEEQIGLDGIGKWDVSVDKSALTDETSVFLSLFSEDNIRPRFGSPGPALIMLRCMENTTSVYFTFNEHHMADLQSYGVMDYRIDDESMKQVRMAESTDNKALGLWRGGKAIPFAKKLIGHDQLIVRVTPYGESSVTATFDIRGIDDAIVQLRDTCNW